MAVPKRKTTRMKRGQRRSHDALSQVFLSENKTTGEFGISHHISKDGFYNGKKVIIKREIEEQETANA